MSPRPNSSIDVVESICVCQSFLPDKPPGVGEGLVGRLNPDPDVLEAEVRHLCEQPREKLFDLDRSLGRRLEPGQAQPRRRQRIATALRQGLGFARGRPLVIQLRFSLELLSWAKKPSERLAVCFCLSSIWKCPHFNQCRLHGVAHVVSLFMYRSLYNRCCGKESRRLVFQYSGATLEKTKKGTRASSGIRPGRGAATRYGIILASGV